jgi:hypothetical protein
LNCNEEKVSISALLVLATTGGRSTVMGSADLVITVRFTGTACGLISIPSMNFSDFLTELASVNATELTAVCALTDNDVPEKMPRQRETN